MISRRHFVQGVSLMGLGLLAGCGPLPWQAQTLVAKVHRVARLVVAPPSAEQDELTAAFRQGMGDLGYVEGQNLLLEQRHANGRDRLPDLTVEVVRLQPDIILVSSATDARAMRAATTSIPIVSAGNGDLVGRGVAASHARPGGNVTGLSTPPLAGKQLQLLQEALPTLLRVAVLFDATNPDFQREPYEEAARALGLQLLFVGTGGPRDLELGFEAATSETADGLFVGTGSVTTNNQTRIAELTMQRRLPSMWQASEAVGRGGLMGYAPNRIELFRRAAYYVDRILKGTSPADLPVEQPREFDFVINLKTAQALGLTIPQHVLLQATEVIQ
jgi:putative ABC transport system substrate-binding protein